MSTLGGESARLGRIDEPDDGCWRKSSYSGYSGNCVEVASLRRDRVAIRDSKDCGAGPVLVISNERWLSFVRAVKNGCMPA